MKLITSATVAANVALWDCMRDFGKSSGNAANVLRTLEVDIAISVRCFLVHAFAPLFMRKKKTLLPFGPLLLPPLLTMVAAVAEWAVQGVLWSAFVGSSMKPLVVVDERAQ